MTEKYSQKYTVVCFFAPQANHSNYPASEWPMHVTMLDTFKTEWQLNTLCGALAKIAAMTSPFDTLPIQAALLGEDKDVPVKLLQNKGGMLALHSRLMSLVDRGTLVFNTPDFVGDGFLPHATDQESDQVEVGTQYRLGNISLIDMFPYNDYTQREVIETFDFKRE